MATTSGASRTKSRPHATVDWAIVPNHISLAAKLVHPRGGPLQSRDPFMSQFYQLLAQIQADGGVTEDEILPIRQQIEADGKLDIDDVKLLVELYCDADNRCPAFDELFFSTLQKVFLADGQITP